MPTAAWPVGVVMKVSKSPPPSMNSSATPVPINAVATPFAVHVAMIMRLYFSRQVTTCCSRGSSPATK